MCIGTKLKNFKQTYWEGNITFSKKTVWLLGMVCLLAGIVYGLTMAPFTHGVTIGSNNGNNCHFCPSTEKEDCKKKKNSCKK